MPSFKLIAGLGGILLVLWAVHAIDARGYARAKGEGEARYNALVAIHAARVSKAVEDARQQAEAQAARQRAAELELARKDEARAISRAAALASQLRSLRDAADADPELARCLALPLPDGLRREPTPP